MKRVSQSILAISAFLAAATPAFAQPVTINITKPENAVDPAVGIGKIITVFISFLIIVAVLAALIFIVLGAFQWITSGGDKAKVESARNHIIAAIVGLIIIALSFVIINVVTQVLGIGSITNLSIPSLKP